MSARRLIIGCAVVALALNACGGDRGQPRAVRAERIPESSVVTTDRSAPSPSVEPSPVPSTEPSTAAPTTPPLTASNEPPDTTLPRPAIEPLVVDVGSAGVPNDVHALPESESSTLAAALLPTGFPIPAGPHAVTLIAHETILERDNMKAVGTETAAIEVDFIGSWPIEDVRDALARSLPPELTEHVAQRTEQSNEIHTVSFLASRFADVGVREVEVIVTQVADRTGVTTLRISRMRRLDEDERQRLRPPRQILEELGEELGVCAAMDWRLDGYWYERSTDGRLGRVGLVADINGDSQAEADRLELTTTVTQRSGEDGATLLDTPDGSWRIHHDGWPSATATFERSR